MERLVERWTRWFHASSLSSKFAVKELKVKQKKPSSTIRPPTSKSTAKEHKKSWKKRLQDCEKDMMNTFLSLEAMADENTVFQQLQRGLMQVVIDGTQLQKSNANKIAKATEEIGKDKANPIEDLNTKPCTETCDIFLNHVEESCNNIEVEEGTNSTFIQEEECCSSIVQGWGGPRKTFIKLFEYDTAKDFAIFIAKCCPVLASQKDGGARMALCHDVLSGREEMRAGVEWTKRLD